ncbi:MAG: DUF4468 domain-containing protein [Odoribacter sp.]
MRKLFFLFLFLPTLLFSQNEKKYLAGAVPEIDGKIIFSSEVNAPGLSKEDIYKKLTTWADSYFLPKKEQQSRVIYSNPEEGQIVAQGQEYLVFTDKTFSLDRAQINYQMFMECESGKYHLKITAIRYLYNTGTQPEIIRAEDQITDRYTLNKAKNKLIRATGKFRTHTIDLVDKLFAAATVAVGNNTHTTPQETIPTASQIAATIPTLPTNTASTLSGYRQISPDKIPGNIFKMLSEDWMLITAGNDQQFNMMTASWGGLGHVYNKPIAFCMINPTRYTYQLMENNDTYTLSFYTETYRDALNYCGSHSGKDGDKVKGSGLTPITTPIGSKAFSEAWMIIECRKLVAQQLTSESILNPEVKGKWGKDLHKIFIGEILNVWVK